MILLTVNDKENMKFNTRAFMIRDAKKKYYERNSIFNFNTYQLYRRFKKNRDLKINVIEKDIIRND